MAEKSYKPGVDRAFTVTTVSGTIYKLSAPDSRGYRTIRRMMAGREKGGSVIMSNSQKLAASKETPQLKAHKPAHKTFFKGKVTEPISVSRQLMIEIFGENRTLISEPVAEIEE
jgi:hypothetical protein